MSWTRLDDFWTDQPILAELSLEARWHYLAMIQFCSRGKLYDGVIREVDARRCSDIADPVQALADIAGAGLITHEAKVYRLHQIDDHIPPPSVRENSERSKIRMQRSRKHRNGDHSECLPKNCPKAESSTVTGAVTRNTRTGTGQDKSLYGVRNNETKTEAEKDAIWGETLAVDVADDPVEESVHQDFVFGESQERRDARALSVRPAAMQTRRAATDGEDKIMSDSRWRKAQEWMRENPAQVDSWQS